MAVTYDEFNADHSELITAERKLFEADAILYGFDITRRKCYGSEPWTEYVSLETGHRWGGWLSGRGQLFFRRWDDNEF